MPEDADLRLPPALEAFGADFALAMELARDQPSPRRYRVWRSRAALRRSAHGRARWGGRRLGVLVFLAAGATAAAATIPLFGGSHRLAGAVPKIALSSPVRAPGTGRAGVPVRLPDGLRYAIPVTPDLEAGDTGWCSGAEFTLPGARTKPIGGGEACAPAYIHAVTVVAGGAALTNALASLPTPAQTKAKGGPPSGASIQQPDRRTVWITWFVVSDQVAMIRVGNASFVPRSDPEFGPHWRAVVIFTQGPLSRFVFLDRQGRPINQVGTETFAPPVAVTTVDPHHLPEAVCSLGASGLPGVGRQWEVVANRVPHRGRLVPPDALFSCARAWYAFPTTGAVYSAAILLNAQNPARAAPNLPGLTSGPRPGEYQEAAATAGQITARRVGDAWLLVQGPNQQRRAALLNSIVVAGTAIHH